MAVTKRWEKIGSAREKSGVVFRNKRKAAGTGTGEDSECRPKPGQRDRSSIALGLQKRYSTAARWLARMTSTPAPTAIAATKKPPAMAAEVPKAAMPAQATRAAPSEKSTVYMLSSPEWSWRGTLQFAGKLAARQSGLCDRNHTWCESIRRRQ